MLREEIVTTEEQHDLDRLGIAKNAREEKIRARDAKLKERAGKRAHDEALPPARAQGAARPGSGADRRLRRRNRPSAEEVGSFGD